MYIKNSKGPSTEPWGTPQVIVLNSEFWLLHEVYWVRTDKYDANQSRDFPRIP